MRIQNSNQAKTWLYTTLALLAFAGNSVLCRLALEQGVIDAGSFTTIRLISGVFALWLIVLFRGVLRHGEADVWMQFKGGSWLGAFYLFTYAACFSYGYVSLDTGTGALILFGAVQFTMIVVSSLQGQRLGWFDWIGLMLALTGFVYLMAPQVQTPTLWGFVLMTVSGAAWGLYTLQGKGAASPLSDTTGNFTRTLPLIFLLAILTLSSAQISLTGVVLAVASGALASACGYAIWFLALQGLKSIQASILQLLVPVLAAVGGVVFAGETLEIRLVIASITVLGGVMIVIVGKHFPFLLKKQ